jgi:cytosine/adenosine deaminase-related metal-dependent hydrolase
MAWRFQSIPDLGGRVIKRIAIQFAMASLSRCVAVALLVAAADLALADSTLFTGGTIIAYDKSTASLNVLRGGHMLVTDDRIVSVSAAASAKSVPPNCTTVDATGKIITPGFVDTHRHGWQTGLKTMASNTTLVEYFMRYSEFDSGPNYTADDVYYGQLAGLYEALNAGVTTTLDHAHHTWSNETAEAGLRASVDSGARVFWSYAFHNVPNVDLTVEDQVPHYKYLADTKPFEGSPVELGVAYDGWGINPSEQTSMIVDLIK